MTSSHPSVRETETRWRFDSGELFIAYGRYEERVDPFPAYRHRLDLVGEVLGACVRAARMPHPVTVWLPDREALSRTNGWTTYDAWTDEEGAPSWEHHIVLSGKRIPIHPAVTRYVVPHEYAHALWLEHAARYNGFSRDELARQYAELRGVSDHHASGGRWHDAVEEIAACDFRILILGAETGYWPHHGTAFPRHGDACERWWRDRIAEVAADKASAPKAGPLADDYETPTVAAAAEWERIRSEP